MVPFKVSELRPSQTRCQHQCAPRIMSPPCVLVLPPPEEEDIHLSGRMGNGIHTGSLSPSCPTARLPQVQEARGWRSSSAGPEMASVDFKTYVDQACRAAEEFVNVYYTTMDKRRRLLSRLYMGTATLVWNGNAVSGQESLSEFFEMLPSSEFQINVVDCQPVHDEATPSQTTVLVVICGTVKFEGNKQRDFNQNFILTAQASPSNTVWKIASDCFRFQDWAC
ncbi:NTF2-related export protein 1 isoform X1 [Neophocaena asiaeorientalis asiaeorientalis]|uniref:NTF2-related export protein 1 isoform X1 n=12 Tax=Artiodactyla TaxID=91561 RepID=A0A341BWH5_NEOAA|nr:NTF2-related export protein 1 isoform X1 [Neophocaena asiaeorientalis asiaeorientalis]XP_024606560.1 NTF2-related export protein 1 isoform X1 [Neophocaena asiaeorientalis asiaeorientalis]